MKIPIRFLCSIIGGLFFSRAVAVCVLMAAVALPSQAVTTTPLLHPLFTDTMVLQRDASDPV